MALPRIPLLVPPRTAADRKAAAKYHRRKRFIDDLAEAIATKMRR